MYWPNYPRVQLPQFEQEAKERYYASYNRNFKELNANYILPRDFVGESSEDFFDNFKKWAVETRNVYIYGPDESGELKKKFPDLEDWRKMSVKDLKKILGQINESKSGKKAELYQRIMDWLYVGNLTDNLQLPLSQLRSLIPVFRVKYQDVCFSKQQIKDITAKSYFQKEDLEAWITHHESASSWLRQGESWKLIFLGNGNLDLNDSFTEQFINNIIKVQTLDDDAIGAGKIIYFKDRDTDSDFQTQEIWEETCRKILLSCNQRLSLKKCEELLGEIPTSEVWGVQLAQDLRGFTDLSQYSTRLYMTENIKLWVRMMCLFSNPSIPESYLRKHWKTVEKVILSAAGNTDILLREAIDVFGDGTLDNYNSIPKTPFTRAMHEGRITLNPFITLANNPNLSSDFLEELIQSPFISSLFPTGIGNGIGRGKTNFLAQALDNNQFISAEFLRKHIYGNSDIHIDGFMEREFLDRVLAQYHLDANLLTRLKDKSDSSGLNMEMPKWSKTISPMGGWEANNTTLVEGNTFEEFVAMNPNPEILAYLLSDSKVNQPFIIGSSPRYCIARNPSLSVLDIWDVKPVSDRGDWFTIFDEDDIAQNGGLTLPFIINRFTSLARHGNYLAMNPAIFPVVSPNWKSGLFNWRF
jgi:hypothetical protein